MGRNFDISDIGNDIIDSREVQGLYDDLISEQEDLEQAIKDARADLKLAREEYDPLEGDGSVDEALEALDDAEQELEGFNADHASLMRDIEDAMEQISDWQYGETLIHERHWVDFVQQDMEEMGYVRNDAWWIEIDWEATAKNVAMDYTEIDLSGHTYYARS